MQIFCTNNLRAGIAKNNKMDYSIGSLSDLITGKAITENANAVSKKFTLKPLKTTINNTHENANSFTYEVRNSQKLFNQNTSQFNAQYSNEQTSEPRKRKMKKKFFKGEPIRQEYSNQSDPTSQSVGPRNLKRKASRRSRSQGILKRNRINEGSDKRSEQSNGNVDQPIGVQYPRDEETIEPDGRYDSEEAARTVFIGNLPLTSTRENMHKLFDKYGDVEAIWFRGVPVSDPKIPKKVAAIKKDFHPKRQSFFGFIRFSTREAAEKALEVNKTVYEGHHLRLHIVGDESKLDNRKAIFIGNLSFEAEEDDLWELFEPCGAISSVRIIRSANTGMGKGFAYVNFESSDSVTLSLDMDVKLHNRQLRISSYSTKKGPKKPKHQKNPQENYNRTPHMRGPKRQQSRPSTGFQGAKFKSKKKNSKGNKGLQQKKRMAQKIAPK